MTTEPIKKPSESTTCEEKDQLFDVDNVLMHAKTMPSDTSLPVDFSEIPKSGPKPAGDNISTKHSDL